MSGEQRRGTKMGRKKEKARSAHGDTLWTILLMNRVFSIQSRLMLKPIVRPKCSPGARRRKQRWRENTLYTINKRNWLRNVSGYNPQLKWEWWRWRGTSNLDAREAFTLCTLCMRKIRARKRKNIMRVTQQHQHSLHTITFSRFQWV